MGHTELQTPEKSSSSEATMRDDFPMPVKELLAKRVGFQCSRTGCGRVTSGPQVDPAGAVNIGVAAHITAASPGGPRFDPTLTQEERRSPGNGIWLCQTCAKLVDSDLLRYSPEELRQWKVFAENRAFRALEGHESTAAVLPVFERIERLMPDLLAEMRQDLATNPLIRECVLVPGQAVYNGSGVFLYSDEAHPYIEGQFHALENLGLARNVTRTNAIRYRLSEDLVQYLTGD
jgi:hypothetical protein